MNTQWKLPKVFSFVSFQIVFAAISFAASEHQKETMLVLDAANSYLNHLEAGISLIFPTLEHLGDSYKPIQEALNTVNDQEVQEYISKTRDGYVTYYTTIKNMVDETKANVLETLAAHHKNFLDIGDYLDEGFLLIREIFKTNSCTEDSLRSYIFEVNRNLSMVITELAFTQNFYNTVIDIIPQTLYNSFPQAIQQALYRTEAQMDAVKRVEFRQMQSDLQAYKDAVDNAKWIVNGFTRHGYTSNSKNLADVLDRAVVGASKHKCRKAKKMATTPRSDSKSKQ